MVPREIDSEGSPAGQAPMTTADSESDGAAGFTGSAAVRPTHRFDEARLSQWMTEQVEGYRGPLRVEQFRGGQSNPTYKLLTPGQSYVLRRKPTGVLLKGAHAVEREFQVMHALRKTGFPVPHGIDDTVVGTPFYVMEYIARRMTRWSRQYRADLAWSQANGGSMRSRAASDST
jgi:aminoglycoside phosphotransferase (APT) family kinase protein